MLRRTCTCRRSLWVKTGRGRQNRVVLAPVAGIKSAEARSARPGAKRRQSADDGDKTNSSPGRARHKPLKPAACGNAGCFRWTRGDYRVHFFCTRAAGASGARHSPRPPGARSMHSSGAPGVAGCDDMRRYVRYVMSCDISIARGRAPNSASHRNTNMRPQAGRAETPTPNSSHHVAAQIDRAGPANSFARRPPTEVCHPPSGSRRAHGLMVYPTG